MDPEGRRAGRAETAFGPHPFWTFSLAVYGAAGVAPAAISLQDRHLLDVNMLLFCLWAGSSGQLLAAGDIAAVATAAEAWNKDVVRPIRSARRAMKIAPLAIDADAVEAVRQEVLAVEIATERAEQMLIAALARAPLEVATRTDASAAAAGNLVNWLAGSGTVLQPADREDMAVILAAALGESEGAAALHRLFGEAAPAV